MGGHAQQGSDKGAAFIGLIGGAVLIGAILYGIVIWTNGQFAGHEEKKAAAAFSVSPVVG
ncbi:hypothetical protein [Gemmatimonas groenlandica]|uniref:Uncharacterized protein n=1 Tax=Gemmatimonas groenlandica TaxID=2732249 RepID=A0A6M4IS44_9BACT|nr:hypothetical protein [Gemmatimonas groenlandica]QJR36256.1 hypothetical protein HKW67_12445 [Gemmatimonas groenlandica]